MKLSVAGRIAKRLGNSGPKLSSYLRKLNACGEAYVLLRKEL